MKEFLRSPSSIGLYSGLLAGIVGAVFMLEHYSGFLPFDWRNPESFYPLAQAPDAFLLTGLSVFLTTHRMRSLLEAWGALAIVMFVLYVIPTYLIFRFSWHHGEEHFLIAQFTVRLWIGAYYGAVLALAYGRRELVRSGMCWGFLGSIPWMLVLTIVQLTAVFEIDVEEELEVLLACVGIAISGIVQGLVAAIPFQRALAEKPH